MSYYLWLAVAAPLLTAVGVVMFNLAGPHGYRAVRWAGVSLIAASAAFMLTAIGFAVSMKVIPMPHG